MKKDLFVVNRRLGLPTKKDMGKRPKLSERLRWIEKRWHDLNRESFPLVTLEWNQPDLHLFMLFFFSLK